MKTHICYGNTVYKMNNAAELQDAIMKLEKYNREHGTIYRLALISVDPFDDFCLYGVRDCKVIENETETAVF